MKTLFIVTIFTLFLICFTAINASRKTAKPEEIAKTTTPTEYEEDIIVGEEECLQLMSTNRGFGSQYQIRFFNSCPIDVWAKICIEERPGKFKMHKSLTKIPKYGYMKIYTYEESPPLSINWTSGQSMPERVPGPCEASE